LTGIALHCEKLPVDKHFLLNPYSSSKGLIKI